MVAILNSAILDSDTAILEWDTLLSSLRFTQKHSHSILTLTQTNSNWLKLIHSHLTLWWQSHWILPSWIQQFCTKKVHLFILTQLDNGSHFEFCHLGFSHLHKKTSLVHSDSISWWQPSWTLPSWIQTLPSWIEIPCYLLSDSLKTPFLHSDSWLKLIPSD